MQSKHKLKSTFTLTSSDGKRMRQSQKNYRNEQQKQNQSFRCTKALQRAHIFGNYAIDLIIFIWFHPCSSYEITRKRKGRTQPQWTVNLEATSQSTMNSEHFCSISNTIQVKIQFRSFSHACVISVTNAFGFGIFFSKGRIISTKCQSNRK